MLFVRPRNFKESDLMTTEHKSDEISEFFNSYANPANLLDAGALAEHYALPCFIASDRGRVDTFPISTRQELIELLAKILGMYKAIGVASGSVTNLVSTQLSPLLSVNQVDWELRDLAGTKLYSFRAIYTIVKTEGALKVCANVACEIPYYLECVARLKAARRASEA